MARRTLARRVQVDGVALHTGMQTTVECTPAAPTEGIGVRRSDRTGAPRVAARPHNVSATERRTALGGGDDAVSTVEHLLAAASALQLDDLTIEVDGPECPILDGSFEPWVRALSDGGIAEQPGDPTIYRVKAPFELSDGDSLYRVEPAADFRLSVTIHWDHPVIGTQSGAWTVTPQSFTGELAPARTFGFESEAKALQAKGLALGGALENVIVVGDDGILGGELRWPDEFVRHKTGDLIGDLALVGGRLKAHVTAIRPSHQGNVALAQRLLRTAERQGPIAMDISRILQVLPHRYPFLLVDRILEVEPDRRIVGIKNVTINEPFFQGHFPGHPIMPGVLIVEAMAQAGGMLVMDQIPDPEKKVVYFMSLDNVKFRRPVVPGDTLRLEVSLLQNRGRTLRLSGHAYVDGQLAAEAEMMARVVAR